MTRKRFHGLKRIKIRMTWNKYNLYNLSRVRPTTTFGTYFQQKWAAKSASRAYHGEQVREKQWQRLFIAKLDAVVPMDHRYLAEHDGAELAAGRGSGLDINLGDNPKKGQQIPYMQMAYAPMERRLDVAIYRSLFASSVRQARQFVTHGIAKVNGKKMPYPGYLLNPGDMFQVEPERVLFATGKTKSLEQIREGREIKRQRRAVNVQRHEKKAAAKQAALRKAEANITAANHTGSSTPRTLVVSQQVDEAEVRKLRKEDLKELMAQIKSKMDNRKSPPKAKRKQELRLISKDIKTTISQISKMPTTDLSNHLADLTRRMFIGSTSKQSPTVVEVDATSSAVVPMSSKLKKNDSNGRVYTESEKRVLRNAMMLKRENPIDESKPYATPWSPRPYMSAFAFIPRYLEVNHNICSAVYLRHPVARPGLAEVPTPFNAETMQLAFNWYLRRR